MTTVLEKLYAVFRLLSMKKSIIIFVGTLLVIFFLETVPEQKINAQNTSSNVSVSDAVYADLALRNYLDNISVYSLNNNPAENVSINPAKQWIPASTVKTFVAMYAYKLVNDGKLNFSDTVFIKANNVVPTEMETDDLPTLNEGDLVSVERLLRQMLIQSDNAAYNTLLDVLDRQKVTEYAHSLGLKNTAVGSKLNLDDAQQLYEYDVQGYGVNTTTAEDYSKAFLLIKNNKIPKAKDIFNVLEEQRINNMLPLLLPKNVQIAHKTGDLDPLYHDGGIIKDVNGSYILSVFSNLGDPNVVAHVSQIVYSKNYDLVGAAIKKKTLGTLEEQNPPLDPLVYAANQTQVLGANTDTGNVAAPKISAADLGITANDLALNTDGKNLPKVIIPANSPFHFLVSFPQIVRKNLTLDAKKRTELDLESVRLKLAEAKDLQSKGNKKLAEMALLSVQNDLSTLVKNKELETDQKNQTEIKSLSKARFGVLSDELKNARQSDRLKVIKQIAIAAKSTVKDVDPYLPQANAATNPSQKPLIGSITEVNDNSITIKTAGGQQITVPRDDKTVIVKQREQGKNLPTDLTNVKTGTTVALIGLSSNNGFTPTFILTNLSKELAAPQPVTVLKVNKKDKTLVVSENGLPIQVNITGQTAIKGSGTNASIGSIKPGDVIVVHGEIVVPSVASSPAALNTTKTTPKPSATPDGGQILKGVINLPGQSPALLQNSPKASPTLSPLPKTALPNPTPVLSSLPGSKTPKEIGPKVIKSVSIEILEKKQDVKKPAPAKKEPAKSQGSAPKSQVPAVPLPPVATTPEIKKK